MVDWYLRWVVDLIVRSRLVRVDDRICDQDWVGGGYRVQGARDSTNQRRVYVDQSEESRGLVGLSSARGSRFDQSEEGIC